MIGVGVIGANPQGSWGVHAHIPAIQALEGLRVAAVATTRMATASETAARFGIPHAFDNPEALAAHPQVDLVTVAVRVPEHGRLVRAALAAGKAVYCEWPLGIDPAEAEALLAEAQAAGVRHVVGLQSRAAPIVEYVRRLVAAGRIGRLLATTMIHSGPWPVASPSNLAYLQHAESGGNFATIRAGHSLDALTYALGDFAELSATTATLIETVSLTDTGGTTRRTTPDQIAVTGRLRNGAVAAVHMQGGPARGAGLRWEIAGEKGDLLVQAPSGTTGVQMTADLTLHEIAADGTQRQLVPPPELTTAQAPAGMAFNVAQMYARFRDGLPLPDFADAVRHHRLLDAVARAQASGQRQALA